MSQVLVVADDLTGAAEIAGVGVEYGLPTQVVRSPQKNAGELVAVDTDSRSLGASEAAARVMLTLARFPSPPVGRVFKKVDSVLRGSVAAEIGAMMSALGKRRALLVPQNPSKGRVIVDGDYFIGGMPLDQTPFRTDPEHPRTTARIEQLLAGSLPIHGAQVGDPLPQRGIIVGYGDSAAAIHHWATLGDSDTLLAGGSDFFRALLECRGHHLAHTPPATAASAFTLIVCGSAAAYSRRVVARWIENGAPVCLIDEETFATPDDPSLALRWAAAAGDVLLNHKLAILAIAQPLSPSAARGLRQCMARAVAELLDKARSAVAGGPLLHLIIEGGATAAAVVEALHWDNFEVLGNMAPGVVTMRPSAVPSVQLTIKPGSYPWPSAFLEHL